MRLVHKLRLALIALLVVSFAVPALGEEGSALRAVDRRASDSAWGEASSPAPARQGEEDRSEGPREPEVPSERPEGTPAREGSGERGSTVSEGEAGERRVRRRRRSRRRRRVRRRRPRDRSREGDRDRARDRRRRRRRAEPEPEPTLPDPTEGTHWTVGARLGLVSVPGGLLHTFVDGGASKTGVAAGAFFAYQTGLFEVSGNIWWADYSYGDEVIFQTAGDRNDPEFVENNLSMLVISADFVWAHWFTRWLAATYGAGLGLGVVLGDVRRTEATPPTGPYASIDEQPTEGYVHCRYDPTDSQWTTPFCEAMCSAADAAAGTCPPRADPSESGDLLGFYDTRENRIPPVLPWINALIGLRFLPHPNFQLDVQGGFGVGFIFVSRLAYRF